MCLCPFCVCVCVCVCLSLQRETDVRIWLRELPGGFEVKDLALSLLQLGGSVIGLRASACHGCGKKKKNLAHMIVQP